MSSRSAASSAASIRGEKAVDARVLLSNLGMRGGPEWMGVWSWQMVCWPVAGSKAGQGSFSES